MLKKKEKKGKTFFSCKFFAFLKEIFLWFLGKNDADYIFLPNNSFFKNDNFFPFGHGINRLIFPLEMTTKSSKNSHSKYFFQFFRKGLF